MAQAVFFAEILDSGTKGGSLIAREMNVIVATKQAAGEQLVSGPAACSQQGSPRPL